MAAECLESATHVRTFMLYSSARLALSTAKNISALEEAVEQLSVINDNEEANELIISCRQKIQSIQMEEERARIKAEQRQKAEERRENIALFFKIFGVFTAVALVAIIIGVNVFSLRSRNGIKYKLNNDGGYTVKGLSVFYKNTENLVISDTYKGKPVTLIKEEAFELRKKLKSVTIGKNVTSIKCAAFSCCTSLTSVDIADSVREIFELAFNRCENLTSVTLGVGVKAIGYEAFADCPKLEAINYRGTKKQWKDVKLAKGWDGNKLIHKHVNFS